MRPALGVLAVLVACSLSRAQEARPAVPDGAVVRLEADRTDWLLGENCVLRFVVENRGEVPITVSSGGDVRGTNRPIRFQVEAIREDGLRAIDPSPDQDCSGGPFGDDTVEPGKAWIRGLVLHDFRFVDRPGTWTVTVSHDLGWRSPAPKARLRLRFRRPLPAEARFLVEVALAAEARRRFAFGGWPPSNPRLDGIRHAEYLPPLAAAAGRGEVLAAEALAGIATADATRALARLVRDGRVPVATEAARALHDRIPDPEEPGLPVGWRQWMAGRSREIGRSLTASWLPDLAPAIRAGACDLLRSRDANGTEAAARLLAELAEAEDMESLAAALEAESKRAAGRGSTPSGFLHPPWALESLRAAVRRASARMPPLAGAPRTMAEAIRFLESLGAADPDRPDGWEGRLAPLVRHESPYVRYCAVGYIAPPLTPLLREALVAGLRDPDPVVAFAACEKAVAVRDAAVLPAVLESMRGARHCGHLEAAGKAAVALGDRVRYLRVAAAMLEDRELGWEALGLFVDAFNPGYGGYSMGGGGAEEMAALKEKWLRFLEAHGAAMAAGRRFTAGDGVVTRDLFPKDFRYSLGGNRMGWPGEEAKDPPAGR